MGLCVHVICYMHMPTEAGLEGPLPGPKLTATIGITVTMKITYIGQVGDSLLEPFWPQGLVTASDEEPLHLHSQPLLASSPR